MVLCRSFSDYLCHSAAASRTSEVIVIDKYPGKNGGHTANDLKVFDCLRFILSKQSV
jgi:hypothetical protein